MAVTDVEIGECAQPGWESRRGRTVWGYIHTPLYLKSKKRLAPFNYPDQADLPLYPGVPASTGHHKTEFVISIPCSLVRSPQISKMVIQYGHGLMGSRHEVLSHIYTKLANQWNWIFFASDWYGMSE